MDNNASKSKTNAGDGRGTESSENKSNRAWLSSLKGPHILCHSDGKIEYTVRKESKPSNIRTTSPIPISTKKFYFDVTILSAPEHTADIDVGLISKSTPNNCTLRSGNNTIGYDTYNGKIYHEGHIVATTTKLRRGDTVGCEIRRIIYDKSTFNVCRFTGNGRYIGHPRILGDVEFYPSVAFDYNSAIVVPNLRESDFALDITGNIWLMHNTSINLLLNILFRWKLK